MHQENHEKVSAFTRTVDALQFLYNFQMLSTSADEIKEEIAAKKS
jgi:hypothetical protein